MFTWIENYDVQETRRIARSEGWEEGKAEGREEGKAEGREEGKAEGWQEGKAEGWQVGKAEGKEEVMAALAKLLQEGVPFDVALDKIRLSLSEGSQDSK
jgi:flagellar biosynthesis/type III secretory pathway protein FliH